MPRPSGASARYQLLPGSKYLFLSNPTTTTTTTTATTAYCCYPNYCCYPQPGNEEPFAIVDYTEKMVARVAELADSAKSARTIAIEVYEEYDSISKDQPRTIIAMNK